MLLRIRVVQATLESLPKLPPRPPITAKPATGWRAVPRAAWIVGRETATSDQAALRDPVQHPGIPYSPVSTRRSPSTR